jgi:hypothetical protein
MDPLFSKIRSGDVFAEKSNLKKAIEIIPFQDLFLSIIMD